MNLNKIVQQKLRVFGNVKKINKYQGFSLKILYLTKKLHLLLS